ncbi:MAG: hypothetical protein ACKPKO_26240, partial [Candidatus Fonsibacter sp.]
VQNVVDHRVVHMHGPPTVVYLVFYEGTVVTSAQVGHKKKKPMRLVLAVVESTCPSNCHC